MAYWTYSNPTWMSLSPTQKAAAMSLMEADSRNPQDAQNVLGAIINRAQKTGRDLSDQVSSRMYQPTFEDSQEARLNSILKDPNFQKLDQLAQSRMSGQTSDWVGGATHYLAPAKTMVALEAKEPSKYRDWGPNGSNWSGYDPATGDYKSKIFQDSSHAFLAPDGRAGDNPPPPSQPNTPSTGSQPMFNLFQMLGAAGVPMGGVGAGMSALTGAGLDASANPGGANTIATAPTGAPGEGANTIGDVDPLGANSVFGKLGMLAKSMGGQGNQGGVGGLGGQGGQDTDSQNLSLSNPKGAAEAMKAASGDSPMMPTGQPRFDVNKLQQMLQQMQLGLGRKQA